jgi:oligopeptidase B
MSVAARRGPWWYYGRTEEGKNYGIHCRRPATGGDELPPAGEPGADEQVLLDENVLAEGHEYFAVGTAVVSPDHSMLAYGTDTAGDERYELRFRSLDGGAPSDRAPEMVPDTGYGLAWASGSTTVFYVRLDEPCARTSCGATNSGPTPPVMSWSSKRMTAGSRSAPGAPGTGPSCWSPCTAPTPPNGWPYRPTIRPRAPRVVLPRQEGREYAVDHLTPAGAGGPGWFVVLTNEDGTGLPDHGRAGPGSGHGTVSGARSSPTVPGCASRTSMRSPTSSFSASGPTPRRGSGCSRWPPDPTRGRAICSPRAGWCRPPRARRRSGWAQIPSRS